KNARGRTGRRRLASLASSAGPCVLALWALSAQPAQEPRQGGDAPTLAETRLAMDKWIETQQILMRERKDWQQGKEILTGRLELVRGEITGLEQKIEEA